MRGSSSLRISLEKLSEIVIQTLKEICAEKKALTPKRLSESLYERQEMVALMQSFYQGHGEHAADAEAFASLTPREVAQSLGSPSDPELIDDIYLKEWQGFYVELLDLLDSSLSGERPEVIAGLKKRIVQSRHLDELVSAGTDVIQLVESLTSAFSREKSQVTGFIHEIEKNLAEIEQFVSSSASRARQSNESYNHKLDRELEGMRDSLRTSGSLEELKRNIIFKITTIKQYMDEKSDEDATRLLEARSEIDRLKMNLTTVSGEIVEMRKKAQSLEEEIMIDPLTGIHNRRACDPLLSEEMRLYRVYRHIFSVVLIDIDHFKRINDTYGHVVGDRCLNELARRMKQNIRKMDFLCRFGGEEFLLLLSGTREERAAQTAEKLRKVVESTLFMYQDHGIRITISAGVGQPNPADETPEALLKRVDSALYHAKGTGRNRVVRWSSIADQQNGRQDNASG